MNLRRNAPILILLVLTTAWLGACSLTPPRSIPPTTFLLPIPPPHIERSLHLPPLLVFPITAPSWLDTRALYLYRRGSLVLQERPDAVWIAPLPDLMTSTLREVLLPHERPGTPRLALHVHLLMIGERIGSAKRQVVMLARTRLVSLIASIPDRSKLWRLVTSARPGVRGQTRAVARLNRRFDRDVLSWLARTTMPTRTVGLAKHGQDPEPEP